MMKSCVLWKDSSNGQTQNSGSWKTVHRYSWVVKLVDFLKKTMKDGNCVGAVRVECIEMAAIFIGLVTHPGEGGAKNNIVTKIAVTFNRM